MGPAAVTWLAYAAEHGHKPSAPPDLTTVRGRMSSRVHEWARERFHLWEDSYDERRAAIHVLSRLGPDAAPAIPALVRTIHGGDDRRSKSAAVALAVIGPQARPAILQALADAPVKARVHIVTYLNIAFTQDPGRVSDAEFAQIIGDLIRACHDPVPEVRLAALNGIAGCMPRGYSPAMEPAIPVAIALLSDPDLGRRQLAAMSLGPIGPPAAPAVPRLLKLLDGADSYTMVIVADTLSQIDPTEKRTVPYLRAIIQNGEQSMERDSAQFILKKLGESPKDDQNR